MSFADIAVNAPAAPGSVFTYAVPARLDLQIGHAVWVPFGSRTVHGIVVGIGETSHVTETRDVFSLVASEPLLFPLQVELALWMSKYYLSPVFDCLSPMLPPGMPRNPIVSLVAGPNDGLGQTLDSEELALLVLVRRQGRASMREISKSIGKANALRLVTGMVKKGLVVRRQEFEPPQVKRKVERVFVLAGTAEGSGTTAPEKMVRSKKQTAVLRLIACAGPQSVADIKTATGVHAGTVRSMVAKGILEAQDRHVVRDPLSHRSYPVTAPPVLTLAQALAWSELEGDLKSGHGSRVVLIRGVTGSGKTELYLRALELVVNKGKRAIVLVPEISLTAQTISRFASRFPGRVAVLHSRLSPGEQYDEWRRIKEGGFDVVVGARGALFAPQPDLALVVIDEEHEWTYKQEEQSPRYHAREVARRLCELSGATLVLGSATPDVGTYYQTEIGGLKLLTLPDRITAYGEMPLPDVDVVDMRAELRSGNRSVFSGLLRESLVNVLANHEQAIIFLNRRGSSTSVVCRSCGHVMRCKRCQVSLTYHSAGESLVCHLCNGRQAIPLSCPACMSRSIKFLGLGTEKVESLLKSDFPGARILRWDRDASTKRHSDEQILDKVLNHEVDILVGTQMVAKGLDLPLVTLVGVVNADINLYLPDFRAGERTFQLLCQVAGRAGRGKAGGRVVVQTYNPDHYSIMAAAGHDYVGFYSKEIAFRRALAQPPFVRLAKMVYQHSNQMRAREEVERIAGLLRIKGDEQGEPSLAIVGPAPCFVSKLRGKNRWQLIVKAGDPSALLSGLALKVGWTVDIDPVSVA